MNPLASPRAGLMPRFGWGGTDAHGRLRPMPEPEAYRLTVTADEFEPSTTRLKPGFIDQIARRVFRQSLNEPGFTVITGLDKLFGRDAGQTFRQVQVDLAQRLAQLRDDGLNLPEGKGFSFKYLGRSNKTKLNPIHCDTKSSDSVILMLYEPSKDIRAFPFVGDLSQFAQDNGVKPESLMNLSSNAKAHYGKQLAPEHHDAVLAQYALDLPELSADKVSLVVMNDSIGSNPDGGSKLGNVHGVRNLEVTGPNPQRYFNHVVMDVEAHNAGINPETFPATREPFYFAKATPETQRVPLGVQATIQDYVTNGTIYYRKDSDK